MSKSLKNAFDPIEMIGAIGLDTFRYFLMREMNLGGDTKFNETILEHRINQDLSNNLGNLIQRTLSMIKKYTGGALPPRVENSEFVALDELIRNSVARFHEQMNGFQFSRALESVFHVVDKLNKLIEENKPWEMAKKNPDQVPAFLRMLLDGISISMLHLQPFLRSKFEQYVQITGLKTKTPFTDDVHELHYNNSLPETWKILFPRIILAE
jgi:methionyl-tRNA synthetase